MVLHHDKLKRCEDRAIPLWIWGRRHVLFEKDNQRSATDPDPEVDVAKSEIVPDELPFPEGVPVPEIPDEPGLSSQLYQAQIGESQDFSSAPSLGGQRQVGEPGSGLMQPGLNNASCTRLPQTLILMRRLHMGSVSTLM